MKYYTMKLNESQLNQLKHSFATFVVEENVDDILFVIEHNFNTITAYKSGKTVLEGEEINSQLVLIKNILDIKDYEAIGSDEVGTQDVFGPVVVCSTFVSLDDIEFLESLGIRDSRSITTKRLIQIAPVIAKRITHSLVILKPFKYNELVNQGYNLNRIKAFLHNHMIIKTTAKVDKTVPVIVDQFCTSNNYFNYLKEEKLVYRDIDFQPKDEDSHISVIAASIIARYAFFVEMHKMSKKLGMKLKLGATKEVDDQLESLASENGNDFLSKVAKCNFKNVTRLLD
ncbi:MAG: ribonuclease HIII [Candidatus Phytoplasma sp.]|nr:ribonuclease HIII [Phytoplasma sp.]